MIMAAETSIAVVVESKLDSGPAPCGTIHTWVHNADVNLNILIADKDF
jgi:hypothetical protein